MKRPIHSLLILSWIPLLLCPCCASGSAAARPAKANSAAQAKIKASVELVRADVSIIDSHGRFVGGLKKGNFRVSDNGIEQPITFFASTEAPAQVLVLVETSPSVFLIHRQHLDAAYALLDGLGGTDRVAIAVYADTARLVLPFTSDKGAVNAALANLDYGVGMGELNFYDAVSSSLDWLAETPGKKALLLLTTGLDTSPPDHWDQLKRKLFGSEVTIFPVALGGSLRSYQASRNSAPRADRSRAGNMPGLSFSRANQVLESLAGLTGGRAYFPKSDNEFVAIYHQIAEALRHQYTLGFRPAVRDGKYHSLQVEVFNAKGRLLAPTGRKPGYRVYARPGYRAPSS